MKLTHVAWLALLLLPLLACSGSSGDNHAVSQAYAQQQSKRWLTLHGTVSRILPDDQKGSRHQRFIVRLTPEHTVLIAHNIDLAPRVPIQPGLSLSARGRYEWNPRGGVLHWTHHDPAGKRAGGWIELAGRRYR